MSGHWDDPAFPKLGWDCIEVYDSLDAGEELHFTCQMCTTTLVRYVHVMAHPDYPEELSCGCVCAGHMEGDGDRAHRRETLARRRQRFPNHANWHYTAKGNVLLRVERHRLLCFEKPDGHWRVSVTPPRGQPVFGRKTYATLREAKLAAFDALIWAKERA